ncbi:MAG: HAMP domain-containing histidine kinase, partial [Lachnospiraceae bacterium]|nr:HAMP domain-containing histidine kinase [Lachnospiraceae bacterium]
RKTLILSLSHDIKTPLSSIELYSKALSEHLYDTQERKDQALQGIARNVKEIKGYVNEIVTASREDFLNLEVRMGEYYLSEVMKATESYYQDKLSVIHTEFEVDEIPECLVRGDRNRMVEVLQNVMENAIKYGDGKRIRISFGEEEDCKLIQIENSGCNLKKEELPNLFDSFYRGSNSAGMKGNGLGLYICKTLMRKMDGEIFAGMKEDVFRVTIVVRIA